MRVAFLSLLVLSACGEPTCPIEGLPPCDGDEFLAVADPLPDGAYDWEAMVTAVTADSLTVERSDTPGMVVTFPLPAPIALRVGDTVVLENRAGSPGVEIYAAGRLVGYVGRVATHRAPDEWIVEAGPLELELEPVCIRDTGSRSWCESGDDATTIVYAARIGGVVVPPGETRTGLIGTSMATVRNRGINAQVDCEQTCTPIRQGQFGLDIAVQP